MGAWERAQLLQLSLEMISQIYWNLFKWFLEIEIPTFSCISPSVIWIEKEISLKWLKYIMSTFSFLEWNSHFDEIGWNGQSSLAAACFIVFGHLFQIVLDISTPESSFAVTYWMRGFFTYLSQSLAGAENARECIYGNLIFYGNIYFVFYRNICLYHGNILKMLWKYICLKHWEGRGMPGNASLEICILYSIEYILYILQIYLKFSHIPT